MIRNPDRVASIKKLDVSAYTIPTDSPESDGTLQWNETTLVLVEVEAGDQSGLGYTYADRSTAHFIHRFLAHLVVGQNALAISTISESLFQAVRNLGREGICAMAISAIDAALWDIKGKLLGLSLFRLLSATRESVEVYGSGGFTSYDQHRLCKQLSDWTKAGISAVKMKVGRSACADVERVAAVRDAIGDEFQLFVDANGAYSRKQALEQAEFFAEFGVTWFEEPVSSNDLDGLHLLRNEGPAGMNIAAGEYGYNLVYFRRMLEAQAVDVLQADATRCGGISGFLEAAALCRAFGIQLSAHCAPALHLPVCCACPAVVHMEYFHDHVRIEEMLFDGVHPPISGRLHPDPDRPGLGIELKRSDAKQWEVAL